jgi:lysophospholipase L1-like esterase
MAFPPYTPYGPVMDLSALLQILTFRQKCPGVGAGRALLIGDSITNQLYYPTANGDWVLNFGVNGARAHDMLPVASQIISIAQPVDVVLAIGTNDLADPTLTYWNWQQDYFDLALSIVQAGVRPVLMTILPTEASLTSGPLAAHNDPAKLAEYNQYIKDTGTTLGLAVQDAAAALAGPDGYLPQGSTADGLHPLGALNKPLWAQFTAALATSRAARCASVGCFPPQAIP